MKKITILLLLAISISCKTVIVNRQSQKITASGIELATIGTVKSNILINNFETSAIPKLNEKIRITSMVLPFNKHVFKAYTKVLKLQGKKSTLKYVDSLPNKPTFVTLQIADKVSLLNQLNSDYNATVYNYLKIAPTAKVVTAISMVFEPTILNEISQAEELYLNNIKLKKYDLELYKNKRLYKTIELTKGTVFSYELASFCWGENTRHQLILVNITGENSKCSNNTYNSYQQIEKKKYSIKY